MARKSQNRSDEQTERIKKRIDCMRTVVEMLQYMVDHPDSSERQIVSEFGVDYNQYRKYVYDENWMKDPETTWNRSEDITKQPTLTWQEQLWLDIHKLGIHDLDAIPVDVIETIDEALNDMLVHGASDYVINRARVLILRYRDRLTYHEISTLMGCSATRVRSIVSTALHNMRDTSPYINFGKRQKINEKRVAEQLDQKNLKLIRLAVWKIQNEMNPAESSTDESPDISPIKPKIPLDTRIVDLDLSVRTTNCLCRAGIYTVSDIFKRSKTNIVHIHSLGRKSYDELIDRLEELGFTTYLDLMDG